MLFQKFSYSLTFQVREGVLGSVVRPNMSPKIFVLKTLKLVFQKLDFHLQSYVWRHDGSEAFDPCVKQSGVCKAWVGEDWGIPVRPTRALIDWKTRGNNTSLISLIPQYKSWKTFCFKNYYNRRERDLFRDFWLRFWRNVSLNRERGLNERECKGRTHRQWAKHVV